MEPVDYVVVLGADDRRLYIKATCQRCIPSAFGTYTLGIEFKKMLSPRDFPALVEAVAMLEAPLSPPPIPLLSQPVNPSPFNLV